MSVEAEVKEAYRHYITAYPAALWSYVNDGQPIDYGKLPFWNFPLLFIVGWHDNPINIVDHETFDGMVKGLYRGFVADGWRGRIALDDCDVVSASPDLAIIRTAGTRYRGDGTVLNSWKAWYWMKRAEAGWRHVAVVDAEAPGPNREQWVAWIRNLLNLTSISAGDRI